MTVRLELSIPMIVAKKKRKENIVEYILYMWQVEDIIRMLGFDTDRIHDYVQKGYQLSPELMEETEAWYNDLAVQMQLQDVTESGHIMALNTIVQELQDLSDRLLRSPSQSLFSSLYYAVLPNIVGLRERSGGHDYGEVEACLVGIYGYLVLRSRGEEVSDETTESIKQFSTFLAMLADRYRSIEEGTLSLEVDDN